MKNHFPVFVIVLLSGCISNSKETPANTGEQPVLYSVKPYNLQGTWVNAQYVETLRKTGSPKKSQEAVDASMIIFPASPDEEVSLIWGFHEGTSGKMKINGDRLEVYTSDSAKPDFEVSTDGSTLTFGKHTFLKSNAQRADQNPAIAEEFLLAGNYELQGKAIEFTADGKINGIDSLSEYVVYVDYFDAGMQVDQLSMGRKGKRKDYAFRFKNRDLIIYELKCIEKEDDLCIEVTFGKELWKLERK